MEKQKMKPIEDAKIECAKTLFNKYSDANVQYEHVDTFEELRKRLQKYMISE